MEHTHASDPGIEPAQTEHPRRARTHTAEDTCEEGKGSIPERTKMTLVQLVGKAEVEAEVDASSRRSVIPPSRRETGRGGTSRGGGPPARREGGRQSAGTSGKRWSGGGRPACGGGGPPVRRPAKSPRQRARMVGVGRDRAGFADGDEDEGTPGPSAAVAGAVDDGLFRTAATTEGRQRSAGGGAWADGGRVPFLVNCSLEVRVRGWWPRSSFFNCSLEVGSMRTRWESGGGNGMMGN